MQHFPVKLYFFAEFFFVKRDFTNFFALFCAAFRTAMRSAYYLFSNTDKSEQMRYDSTLMHRDTIPRIFTQLIQCHRCRPMNFNAA